MCVYGSRKEAALAFASFLLLKIGYLTLQKEGSAMLSEPTPAEHTLPRWWITINNVYRLCKLCLKKCTPRRCSNPTPAEHIFGIVILAAYRRAEMPT
jgi:hypothetical protein